MVTPAGLPAVIPPRRVWVTRDTIRTNHRLAATASILVLADAQVSATILFRVSASISARELLLSVSTFEPAVSLLVRQGQWC